MWKYVVRKPMILYETIETIFRYVNGRTVAKEKEEFLKKYGNQLSPAHLERIELNCAAIWRRCIRSVRPFPRVQSLHTIFSGGT